MNEKLKLIQVPSKILDAVLCVHIMLQVNFGNMLDWNIILFLATQFTGMLQFLKSLMQTKCSELILTYCPRNKGNMPR